MSTKQQWLSAVGFVVFVGLLGGLHYSTDQRLKSDPKVDDRQTLNAGEWKLTVVEKNAEKYGIVDFKKGEAGYQVVPGHSLGVKYKIAVTEMSWKQLAVEVSYKYLQQPMTEIPATGPIGEKATVVEIGGPAVEKTSVFTMLFTVTRNPKGEIIAMEGEGKDASTTHKWKITRRE